MSFFGLETVSVLSACGASGDFSLMRGRGRDALLRLGGESLILGGAPLAGLLFGCGDGVFASVIVRIPSESR